MKINVLIIDMYPLSSSLTTDTENGKDVVPVRM